MKMILYKKYVVIYYRNTGGLTRGEAVHQSKAIDHLSFPEDVSINNLSPKEIEWDYAVIEERHYCIK